VAILYNFASGIFGASIGKLVGEVGIKKNVGSKGFSDDLYIF
jgi:hypothetical protein